MAKITVRDNANELYPDDIYVMEVKSGTLRQNGEGKDFLAWECIITSPPEHAGKTYSHLTPANIGPKSAAYKFLLALGMPPIKENETIEFDTDDYLGIPFVAQLKTVKITKGNNAGKDRNDFKDVWSVTEFNLLQKKASERAAMLAMNTQVQPQVNYNQQQQQAPVQQQQQAPVQQQQPQVNYNPPQQPQANYNQPQINYNPQPQANYNQPQQPQVNYNQPQVNYNQPQQGQPMNVNGTPPMQGNTVIPGTVQNIAPQAVKQVGPNPPVVNTQVADFPD